MKTRLKYLGLTLLLLLFGNGIAKVNSQTNDYNKLAIEYLISEGETASESSIYICELLKSNRIEDNNCGIYRIGTFSDHGLAYLFLVDKEKELHNFLNFENLAETIETVLNFLDNSSCVFTDTQKLAYLRKVIELNAINIKTIPW